MTARERHRPHLTRWTALLASFFALGCDAKKTTTPAPAPPPPSPCTASDGGAPAPLPYVVTSPARAGLWVMDVTGEPDSRQVIARTLQGVVNRTSARIYIVDDLADPQTAADSSAATQHWLSVYQSDLGITMTGSGNLDAALQAFAAEVPGYYLVSTDEPWSINAATTAAATAPGVSVTAADAAALDALGIHQLSSFVGLWPDALTCYTELAQKVGKLPSPGFADLTTGKERPRDFLIQQGVLTLGGYEEMPEWAALQDALTHLPQRVPIYGYPASNAIEEITSVNEISMAGDVLIASDSTPNLSYHQAVSPKTPARPPVNPTNIDCSSAALNVVIALSDGDNLVTETTLYPTADYWLSPARGTIPIAWSVSPALAKVAPAVLDYYVRTVAPGDELVEMIGAGYAYGSQMPDADWFYARSFADMESIGLRVLWLFDPQESGSGHYTWEAEAEKALGCGQIVGLLDGYYPTPFHGALPTEVVGTVPVLRAIGSYSDGPSDIATEIQAQLALPTGQRPTIVFYSAAAWSNTVTGLVAALQPLEAQGVRFLSASAGVRCVLPPGATDGG